MTITEFTASPLIRGDQLADEIVQATGIVVLDRYTFYPPDKVTIAGDDVAAQSAAIQTVIDAHIPDPLYFPEDWDRAVKDGADSQASAIPGWATWDEPTTLDWHDANIKDPLDTVPDIDGLTAQQFNSNAQAIMALYQDVLNSIQAEQRALARLSIALRNKTWPGLQE